MLPGGIERDQWDEMGLMHCPFKKTSEYLRVVSKT